MAARLVDLHCHLDLYPDFGELVRECEAKGIYTLGVTTTPRAWPRSRSLTASTRFVRAALGLHPQLVSERASELPLWEEYLPQARFIGEVGLDASPRFFRSMELQIQVFERILRMCAEARGKILSVHSLRAAKSVLDLIEKCLPPDLGRVVLHWWTGSASEARRAVSLGCYFSVNAEMLRTAPRREIVASLPLDRIVTETDGPFTNADGRAARPEDAGQTVQALARVYKVDAVKIADLINSNLRTLVSVEDDQE